MSDTPSFILVCTGPVCGERGGKELTKALTALLVDRGVWNEQKVAPVKCFGLCPTGPNACKWPAGKFLTGLSPESAEDIVDSF